MDKAIVENSSEIINFGLGYPIKFFFKFTDELVEELHKPVSTKFDRWRVNVNSIDESWAADLIDMQALSKDNKGIKYLLTVIDVFSKFEYSLGGVLAGYTLYLVPVILLFLMRFYSQFFVVHLHIVVAYCLERDNAICENKRKSNQVK